MPAKRIFLTIINYKTQYKKKYPGSGSSNLVNGITGSTSFNDGFWQGWERDDFDVVIDLGSKTEINQIICGFLESQNSWIFLPTEVKVSFSNNDTSYKNEKSIAISDGKNYGNKNRVEARINDIEQVARFIRITATNRKICPDWHNGVGGDAWIFADEIVVK